MQGAGGGRRVVNSERDSRILRLWTAGHGMTGEEIASLFGISSQRVYQVLQEMRGVKKQRRKQQVREPNP